MLNKSKLYSAKLKISELKEKYSKGNDTLTSSKPKYTSSSLSSGSKKSVDLRNTDSQSSRDKVNNKLICSVAQDINYKESEAVALNSAKPELTIGLTNNEEFTSPKNFYSSIRKDAPIHTPQTGSISLNPSEKVSNIPNQTDSLNFDVHSFPSSNDECTNYESTAVIAGEDNNHINKFLNKIEVYKSFSDESHTSTEFPRLRKYNNQKKSNFSKEHSSVYSSTISTSNSMVSIIEEIISSLSEAENINKNINFNNKTDYCNNSRNTSLKKSKIRASKLDFQSNLICEKSKSHLEVDSRTNSESKENVLASPDEELDQANHEFLNEQQESSKSSKVEVETLMKDSANSVLSISIEKQKNNPKFGFKVPVCKSKSKSRNRHCFCHLPLKENKQYWIGNKHAGTIQNKCAGTQTTNQYLSPCLQSSRKRQPLTSCRLIRYKEMEDGKIKEELYKTAMVVSRTENRQGNIIIDNEKDNCCEVVIRELLKSQIQLTRHFMESHHQMYLHCCQAVRLLSTQ